MNFFDESCFDWLLLVMGKSLLMHAKVMFFFVKIIMFFAVI